ncbi:expressed protein [Chlorella variabilis]|uniref:Expressed protein n=1 Tax=Chlorella variabilis TaxID=554065 RepID=E1Z3V4_CHLVA|nr:expressed protein [Chlorella variabilis]EFN59239.1 expressed protein [Chlorella variabilis]|eukprot:XP_005851341.1 expressed protein [Chlorella variabilis]
MAYLASASSSSLPGLHPRTAVHARPAGLWGPGPAGCLALRSTRLRRVAAAEAPPAGQEQAGAQPSGPAQERPQPSQPDWYKAELNRLNQNRRQVQESFERDRLIFRRIMRSLAVFFLLLAGIGFLGDYGSFISYLMVVHAACFLLVSVI